jgi:hypothetical protein
MVAEIVIEPVSSYHKSSTIANFTHGSLYLNRVRKLCSLTNTMYGTVFLMDFMVNSQRFQHLYIKQNSRTLCPSILFKHLVLSHQISLVISILAYKVKRITLWLLLALGTEGRWLD